MPKKNHFSFNQKDLAAARALSALHPEYDNDDYEEDNSPFTLQEAAAMWKATGKDDNYSFGFTTDELESTSEE